MKGVLPRVPCKSQDEAGSHRVSRRPSHDGHRPCYIGRLLRSAVFLHVFRQLYDDALAQASYRIGCQATGEAVVVDPIRDIAPSIAVATAFRSSTEHRAVTSLFAMIKRGAHPRCQC